ncbi:hypothetical protein DFH09DRAFT_1287112 [Mycena vulgaris]|nr:hypothetical protein DFH09DRAFT_1287112 [Mycena vulgaris]
MEFVATRVLDIPSNSLFKLPGHEQWLGVQWQSVLIDEILGNHRHMLRNITNLKSNWNARSPKELAAVRVVSRQLQHKMASLPPTSPSSTKLRDERALISSALLRVQVLLAAFNRLPEKVLAVIFEHFVMYRTTFDSRPKALLLCGVSMHWRSVAISTPSLWTKMELVIRPGWTPAFDTTCISRSYPLPIDIYLRYTSYFPPALDAALRLLGRSMGRIRNLCLDLQQPWSGQYRRRPAHKFPTLKNCAPASQLTFLDISLSPKTLAWEWISGVVANAPKLIRFGFLGDPLPNARWSQLESLRLGSITLVESFRVLSYAPRLRDCAFIITSSEQLPPQRVLVHRLKCLLLQSDETPGIDDVTLLLAHVNLPALISLAIVGGRGAWRQQTIMSFLARSTCTLRRLIFVESRISERQMVQLLYQPSMQKLSSLKLENCVATVTMTFVHNLRCTIAGLPGARIPSLHTIYLSPISGTNGVGTLLLVANSDEKGGYAVHVLDGIPNMSTTFTFDIPDIIEVE